MMTVKKILCVAVLMASALTVKALNYSSEMVSASMALKVPGNEAVRYPLTFRALSQGEFDYQLSSDKAIPVLLYQKVEKNASRTRLTVFMVATEDVYFHFSQWVNTGARHSDCYFLLPGFWYRQNLRSPKTAPSFHTSDSWVVREDRLSTPMTTVFDTQNGKSFSVVRVDDFPTDALSTHKAGEIILSGKTSVGYTGFENRDGMAALSFGFPFKEAPTSYIRKLTLAPAVEAYQFLGKGQSLTLTWELNQTDAADFSDCVKQAWEYSYDLFRPQEVQTPYTDPIMKEVLSNYFVESFVDSRPLKYYSGVELATDDCEDRGVAEIGFVGRTLLNAFNALEYGESIQRADLTRNAGAVFDSYLENGFSPAGFFKEVVNYDRNGAVDVYSIRRQSEGVYATLFYLNHEKQHKQMHPQWEERLRSLLDLFLRIQNPDGSFPRKFRDDLSIVDISGGSTPSATLPLVMGYRYFKDKRYLEAAKRSVDYLEKELINKADYFSSTLDANCEDKEASLYASTAAYFLALVTKGQEREHYAALCRKAAYFALSWYYTWDVPFAQGQMLGDLGLKTRGWGNVSTENNHIDVFVFNFADVLCWLSKEFNEPRFDGFAKVISSSMRQLLPYEGHLCGIAKKGFYPEVVQHTNWDYGKNGKGFYNNIFAPGWTIASLWDLLSLGRAENFLCQ